MTARESSLFWILAGVTGLYLLSRTSKGAEIVQDTISAVSGPRGIRNNNPGNIRHAAGTAWQGASSDQTDPAFVQFTAPEWGIRAMAKILARYASRGIVTISSIVSTWAPVSENDTASYIENVAKFVGIPANKPVAPNELPLLIAAMIKHENGTQPYSIDLIKRGISLA